MRRDPFFPDDRRARPAAKLRLALRSTVVAVLLTGIYAVVISGGRVLP